MKTLKVFILSALCMGMTPTELFAQTETKSQAYWVHEDPVYPAMVADYEGYCSDLVKNCEKYNIDTANWQTWSTDDLRYFHVSPINNMGDLDNSRFSVLQENMGDEEFNKLFDGFDNCYDTHSDYIIHLDHELSYMPDKVKASQDAMEFRKLEFWYVTPQNLEKLLSLARQFKALYAKGNSEEYYSLYRSGFGATGQYIIVAISAKSAADYERIRDENKSKLGDERNTLYAELLKTIIRVETLTGYVRSDLSYVPNDK